MAKKSGRSLSQIPDEEGLPADSGIQQINFSDLKILNTIGEGNYGDVHRGKYFDIDVAIKEILLDDLDYLKYIKREIHILATMRHPFILQFLGVCEHKNDIYIVTEFLPAGDVTALLESKKDVPLKLRLSIATQLAQALIYLHSRDIIHRDLKPDNILLDENNNIRLADFGLARVLEGQRRDRVLTICGTDGFIAPEVMLGMNYTKSCDIFSYGMCLAQIITRKEPGEDFWNRGEQGDLGLDNDEFLALVPSDCPKEFADLTLGCVAFDMDDRPPLRDILELLKFVNGKLVGTGGTGRRQRGSAHLSGAPSLVGTLSRSSLRKNTLSFMTDDSSGRSSRANSVAAAKTGSSLANTALTVDSKSAQMLLFHVMKLVQRSTNEDFSDAEYVEDFLLSYRDFLSPAQLLDLLTKRYQYEEAMEADATDEEISQINHKKKLIQLRTLIFVKQWIQKYSQDLDSQEMRALLGELDALVTAAGLAGSGSTMLEYLEKRLAEKRESRNTTPVFADKAPTAFVPPADHVFESVLSAPASEFARQITLLMHGQYAVIEPRDFLKESWKLQPQGRVAVFLKRVTRVRQWVRASLLQQKEVAQRAKVLVAFVDIALELRKLQNFAALFAILAALQDPNVKRLTRTFREGLTADKQRELDELMVLEKEDYRKYKLLEKVPPAIPHLQLILDELVYVEKSSEDRLQNGIINFRRHRHIGRIARNAALFQQTPYNLSKVESVCEYLQSQFIKSDKFDDNDAKNASLLLEPPTNS